MDLGDTADQTSKHTTAATSHLLFHNQNLNMTESNPGSQQHSVLLVSPSDPQWHSSSSDCTDLVVTEEGLSNGTCEVETVVESHCLSSGGGATPIDDLLALSDDGVPEISNNDLSLPEVCISTNSSSFEEDMNYEVQQAYRIFRGFLLDKHKGIAGPFLHPVGHLEAQHGIGGVRGRGQAQLRQSMCLRRMEEKFVGREYETIAEFVADFRLMLENCYRYHGVDHWISKQAQKLEIMLEQKLTLLSRTLREKTTLAVTSKGRFGAEEERGSGGTSTRRRSAPRSLSTITVGGHESIMVQSLRLEEQQRAKEERRQRDLEKKEAEEMSAKQVEEWEHNLLSQASPQTVNTLWELPAIGHFLCLAQTALNLPEIVFFELERCLLMPRCSVFLSKIMSSLLCPPQRRTTLHRRPALPYRRWESELRQRVLGWYRAMGASQDQPGRAEQLGLCLQFFITLGEESPLEEKPFHLLPFYQRVWLVKGLCDNVYETQKDVQDAVLGQPIHECRESILGYDGEENAYIHFPHFCGADLRIYCQSPCSPPTYPFPPVWVKRLEPGSEGEESDGVKEEQNTGSGCYGVSLDIGESEDSGEQKHRIFKGQNGGRGVTSERLNSLSLKAGEEESDSESSDEEDSSEDSKSNLKINTNSSLPPSRLRNSVRASRGRANVKEEPEHGKQEHSSPSDSGRTIGVETQEPCLSVGEHSYTGRSPARSESLASPVKAEAGSPTQGQQVTSCLECCRNTGAGKSKQRDCRCGSPGPAVRSSSSSSESSRNSSEELIRTKKKRRKKRRGGEQPPGTRGGQLQHPDRTRPCQAAKSTLQRTASTLHRKDERKNNKTGTILESQKVSKKTKDEPSAQPSFKLVCTSLEHLRDLISKTEDELDELESTKKRVGRWYLRREAVKDLHITLIRLLNELSPWEPKLVKAYQRNRLRLKKDFDDFKKHPEYDNFVREERVSSSSSDDEDSNEGRETCSLPDHYREAEEEDHLEHHVPRGLWNRGDGPFVAESMRGGLVTYMTPNHLKRSLSSADGELSPLKRCRTGSDDMTTLPVSGLEPRPGLDGTDQPMIVIPSGTAVAPAQTSLGPRPFILHPTIGLPKGYTPIPTLLAKSVGNKVTLMKRPADYPGIISHVRQSKVQRVATKPQAQSSLSQSQQLPQSSQQSHTQGPQPVTITPAGALHNPPQANPTQTAVPKSPVQVVYKVPEGLGHLLRKEGSSPVKISVQPIVDQKTGEKIMQQVMILPSNLLIQKAENKVSSQQQSIQAPFFKGPLCMTSNAHGFSIPDARIPVQQVAPLKDTRTVRTPSISIFPHQPLGGFKVAHASTPQSITPNRSPATTLTSALSTHPSKPTDPKQELKTVCIRDSQSILVTTRGGNTGVVKVRTSSDLNAPGAMPASPVITISPQFKAFLVSKTSTPVLPPAPIPTSSCVVTAATSTTTCRPPQQAHSILKSPVATVAAAPGPTPVTCTIPPTGPASQVEGTTVTFALNQGHSTSAGSVVTANSAQAARTLAAGFHLPTSPVKRATVAPAPSVSGNITPNVPTSVQCINKPGAANRAGVDQRSQFTKFILVTPSSSSNVAAVPKVTSSPTTALSGSRVMFISQSAAATASSTSLGSIPKPTTSISTDTVKMGLTLGQAVGGINSEALSKVQSITLPSGVQIRLPGRTQGLALPQSPSKSTPVSVSTTGPLAVTSTLVHPSPTFLCGVGTTPAPVIPYPQAAPIVPHTQSPVSSVKPVGVNCNASPVSTTPPSTTATVQQRIVINTTTPLAAGTQILLNNTRFVVPPQGLSPGSHVLIISSPVPPPVPSSNATISPAVAPSQGPNPTATAPRGPVLPGPLPARLPGVPALSSPVAAGTPAVVSRVLAATPNVAPVRLAAAPTLGFPVLSSTTNVVPAMSRLPAPQTLASPCLGTPTLGSASPRLASTPALVSPMITTAPALGSALPRLPAGTHTLAQPSPTTPTPTPSPALASPMSRLPATPPLTSLGLPSTCTVALPTPGMPALAPLPSAVSVGTPCMASTPPAQHGITMTGPGPGIQPQQTALRLPAPSTVSNSLQQVSLHTGLTNTTVRQQVATVMQPLTTFAGTRTQVLPTVAIPPIGSTVSRMQSLPVATVPPIGSAFTSLQASPVATMPPSDSTVIMTQSQPIRAMKTIETNRPPVVLTNQVLGKPPLQASVPGVHTNLVSKLLVSPDGTVLNTVQGPVNPAGLPAMSIKPLATLAVSPSSSIGRALPIPLTDNPPPQPAKADTSEPMN